MFQIKRGKRDVTTKCNTVSPLDLQMPNLSIQGSDYYAILYKGLEHLRILVSLVVQETILYSYRGIDCNSKISSGPIFKNLNWNG